MQDLREIIDNVAAAQGVSLETLAAKIGVSRATIYNWRNANPRWYAAIVALLETANESP